MKIVNKFIAAVFLLASIAAGAQTAAVPLYIDKNQTLLGFHANAVNYSSADLSHSGVTLPPLLSTPVNSTFTSGSGSCATATYFYRVTALDARGETQPSTETSLAVTGPTAAVNVNWGAVANATGGYNIYGRTTGAEQLIGHVAQGTTTFLDTCTVTPSGALPTVNTTGQTVLTAIVNLSGVRALTFSEQCTQVANAWITSYAEDGTTVINSYELATSIPSTWQQIFVATELAPNATAGTLQSVVRLPQRAAAFALQNTTSTSGTCSSRLMTSFN